MSVYPNSPLAPDDGPPPLGRNQILKALLGGLAIVLAVAVTTATAGLLQIKGVADDIGGLPGLDTVIGEGDGAQKDKGVDRAEAGDPRTFLLLGSDRRYSDLKKNNKNLRRSLPARSDTMMLVRVDPDEDVITVLSIPRDLKVTIPGHGTSKLNDAYSIGGPALTLETLRDVLGIEINHVLNVNFGGFRKLVTTVGCVYADIDRRYYHSNVGVPPSQQYAEIDIDPGYQRLCGQKALDYVRFRHADNDLVRGARQQDFLRAMKDQVGTSGLADDRDKLLDIFKESVQADGQLKSVAGLESVLKLALFSAGKPVKQVPFPGSFAEEGGVSYVTSDDAAIERTVRRFEDPPSLQPAKKQSSSSSSTGASSSAKKKPKRKKAAKIDYSLLRNVRREGEDLVANTVASGKVTFPLYFPTRITNSGRFTTNQPNDPNPRVYTLRDRAGKKHQAYRIVMLQNQLEGQYVGVQGTTWRTPPLLKRPTSTRVVNGRRLLLFRDGERLRFVAWRTKRAVYWVSNSLTTNLSNDQMLGIAATLGRFGEGGK
ncbi:LCP family protein [Paraconexibacter algicola]|uniref:LytR family transcriptional regulator n=1 Tax=Paraconexibacter algicola TaxID=2133960 RepID=A0A2T4UMT2_9ACTN|nr:LCP family protein [Paraconexibacter algicola]PTL60542.1 LytR family transcriptional regulator [Paraconexibacter algicola]